MGEQLTYREAAKRVRRSVRTIKRWRKGGMPMGFDASGRRVVNEGLLLAWWRERMTADPVHQQRLRAQLEGAPAEKSAIAAVGVGSVPTKTGSAPSARRKAAHHSPPTGATVPRAADVPPIVTS